MTWNRAGGAVAALLVIGWVAVTAGACDRAASPATGRSRAAAVRGLADGAVGKGGTQLDYPQPAARSPLRQAAPTVVQVAPTARPLAGSDPRVGALFAPDANGSHFCTASVVPSPGHDLVMTAAHCISGGRGNAGIVFIPAYANGIGPYGVWTARTLIVDPRWTNGGDPDDDVGFVVLNPNDGKAIQDVVGADQIDFNAGYRHLVRVTGYPERDDAPVTCENWTTKYAQDQLRFACGGFYAGTSGSPWLVVASDGAATRPPGVVGVIGGYERGGDTNAVSYSAYLSDAIEALYQQAETASAGPVVTSPGALPGPVTTTG
jgi:V8-like Glu-specific endopeptidase